MLCKLHYSNSHMEMRSLQVAQHQITVMVNYSDTTREVNLHLHMEAYKWDRKWMFMKWTSHSGGCSIRITL